MEHVLDVEGDDDGQPRDELLVAEREQELLVGPRSGRRIVAFYPAGTHSPRLGEGARSIAL